MRSARYRAGVSGFIAVRPVSDQSHKPGWRFSLRRESGDGLVDLAEERVLPEKVDEPRASAVLEVSDKLILTRDDVRWLNLETARLLAQWEEES